MKKILILLFFIIPLFYLNSKNINDKTKDDAKLILSVLKIINRDYIKEIQFKDLFIKTIKNIIVNNNLPIEIIETKNKITISDDEIKKTIKLNNFEEDYFTESIIELRNLFEKNSIHIANRFSDNYIIMICDYILKSLDPDDLNCIVRKSDYTEKEPFGIGLSYYIDKYNKIIIKGTYDNGPAQKAGILENDIIIKINNQEIENPQKEDIDKIFTDKQNPIVELTILRGNNKKEINFLINKEIITNKIIENSILENKIGYIKIFQFANDLSEDLKKIADKMSENKVKALIIDLRNNPGGLLNECINACKLFLKKDEKIVEIKGKNPIDNEIFKNDKIKNYKLPIVILSNQATASGAEIIIAALQDNKRCIVVGEKTYGSAKVATTYSLKNDFYFRLTIALFITPNGKIIDGKGIEPDYLVKNENNKDLQLQKAIDLISNKKMLLNLKK